MSPMLAHWTPICMNCVTHVYESNVTHVSDCTVLGTPLRRARDLAMRNESQRASREFREGHVSAHLNPRHEKKRRTSDSIKFYFVSDAS
jgi:hypothetical protein